MRIDFIKDHYVNYDEDSRLLWRHGRVEYLTTMKYIHDCLGTREGEQQILELGAGTGRYSVTLAKEGYAVTAVELLEHHIQILKEKLDGTENINVLRGNALDLYAFRDNAFDVTLLLGPMYHLYTRADKLKALKEAVRVTKPGGYILVAYCMNEPSVVKYLFLQGNIGRYVANGKIHDDWRLSDEPAEVFSLVRTEDIDDLDSEISADRIKLVATDGATNYFREFIDQADDETFKLWMDYHMSTCERADLLGASHHTLDILMKRSST